MKKLFAMTLVLTAFSTSHALTCMSSDPSKQSLKAEIMGQVAQLTHNGEAYANLYLRQSSNPSGFDMISTKVYKQIGEYSNVLKVKSGGFAGITRAELFQVSKGGTRKILDLNICR